MLDPPMILDDRSESVYVYPVKAQLFAFWVALTVNFKSSPSIQTHVTCVGHDGPPFCTTTFDLKYSSHVQGCSFTAYEKYQYQIWNGVLNTGTVHKFQHDDGSQDMPENNDFAIVGLANTISSWRCECA